MSQYVYLLSELSAGCDMLSEFLSNFFLSFAKLPLLELLDCCKDQLGLQNSGKNEYRLEMRLEVPTKTLGLNEFYLKVENDCY